MKQRKAKSARTEAHRQAELPLLAGLPLSTGEFSIDTLFTTWPQVSPDRAGLLWHDTVVTYQQPILRIYKLAPTACRKMHYIAGPAHGVLRVNRALGSAPISTQFYRKYTRPCPDSPDVACQVIGGSGRPGLGPVTGWVCAGFEVVGLNCQVVSGGIAIQQDVEGAFKRLNPAPGG